MSDSPMLIVKVYFKRDTDEITTPCSLQVDHDSEDYSDNDNNKMDPDVSSSSDIETPPAASQVKPTQPKVRELKSLQTNSSLQVDPNESENDSDNDNNQMDPDVSSSSDIKTPPAAAQVKPAASNVKPAQPKNRELKSLQTNFAFTRWKLQPKDKFFKEDTFIEKQSGRNLNVSAVHIVRYDVTELHGQTSVSNESVQIYQHEQLWSPTTDSDDPNIAICEDCCQLSNDVHGFKPYKTSHSHHKSTGYAASVDAVFEQIQTSIQRPDSNKKLAISVPICWEVWKVLYNLRTESGCVHLDINTLSCVLTTAAAGQGFTIKETYWPENYKIKLHRSWRIVKIGDEKTEQDARFENVLDESIAYNNNDVVFPVILLLLHACRVGNDALSTETLYGYANKNHVQETVTRKNFTIRTLNKWKELQGQQNVDKLRRFIYRWWPTSSKQKPTSSLQSYGRLYDKRRWLDDFNDALATLCAELDS